MALEAGVMVKWLSTIKQAGSDGNPGALTIEKMKLDEKGKPQPTGEFETLVPIRWCWRWARTSTCRCCRA